MKKITILAASAFVTGRKWKRSNTEVDVVGDMSHLYLFGNLIAIKNLKTGKVSVSNAGWKTNTTRERLNGIPGVNVTQKNFQWYLNGEPWNGEWKGIDYGKSTNI